MSRLSRNQQVQVCVVSREHTDELGEIYTFHTFWCTLLINVLCEDYVAVWGLGFGVWGLGFGVWGLGFGVWGLGFGVWGSLKRYRVF